MKKNILLILSTFLFCYAYATDFYSYCPIENPNRSFSGVLSSISGINFLSKTIAEQEIQKLLKKEFHSNFKVSIKPYWGTSILGGKFKSFKAKADHVTLSGNYFTDMTVETICKYNNISYANDIVSFPDDFILKYSAKITQDDINKTLKSSTYQKLIEEINNSYLTSSFITIENSIIEIKENNLVLKYTIKPNNIGGLFAMPSVNMTMQAGLKAQNGKIQLCDIKVNSRKTSLSKFLPLINKLNPLAFGFDINDASKGKLYVENVNIKDGKILLDGFVVLKNK